MRYTTKSEKKQVFASSNVFQIENMRKQVKQAEAEAMPSSS